MSETNDSQLPDLRYVRELAKVFRQYDLGEIEIEAAGQRILLRKQDLNQGNIVTTVAPQMAAPAPVASNPSPAAAAVVLPASRTGAVRCSAARCGAGD